MSGAKKYLGLLGVITLLTVAFQPTAKAQSLQEFLQSAYDNHPALLSNVRFFRQQFEGARVGSFQAGGFLPTLTYTQSDSYRRTNPDNSTQTQTVPTFATVSGQNVVTGFDTVTVPGSTTARKSRNKGELLRLQQNLFASFRDIFLFRGFLDNADAFEFQYYSTEQEFLRGAIIAYLNVIRRKNVVSVRLANYESLQGRLDIVQRLYDIGDTTELDLQQSRAQLLSAQALWEQALAQYEAAVAEFRNLGAMEPTDLAFSEVPTNMPLSQEEGELQALKGNFDMRRLELLEKASKSAYRAAQTQAGISVDLRIDYQNGRNYAGERGGSSVASGASYTESVITTSIPLYNPSVAPRIRQAYQAYLRAKSNYSSQRLSTISTFQSNWASFTRSAKGLEFQRQAAEAAQIALDNVVLQQRAGLRSIVEVLDEETRLVQAQVAYEDARFEHLLSAYRVLESTGQLTAKDLGLQTKHGEELADYFNSKKSIFEVPGAYTAIKGLFVEEE